MAADPPFPPVLPFPPPSVDDFLCARFGLPNLCEVMMPGGMAMAAPNVLEMMQPALAPLAPIFTTIEAVVQVKKCMDATIEAITSLDVTGLVECVGGLARLVDKLASLVPAASVPILVVNVLDCTIRAVSALRSVLLSLQAQAERIARTIQTATDLNDSKLNTIAVCATDRLGDTLSDEMKGLIVIGRLLGMLSSLASVAGIDLNIPDLESIAGTPLSQIIEPIDDLLDALTTIRNSIPLP